MRIFRASKYQTTSRPIRGFFAPVSPDIVKRAKKQARRKKIAPRVDLTPRLVAPKSVKVTTI